MPRKARMAGRFLSSGASLKWMSMAWAPSRSSIKRLYPIMQAMDNPIEDQSEYRPPTQSQKPNMFPVSIPKSRTFVLLVEMATKCFLICSFLASELRNQVFAETAFVMVSWVVNVFDAIRKSVVSLLILFNVMARWAPSTLET